MKKVIVFGMGTFGRRLAVSAAEFGANVTATDVSADMLRSVRDLVSDVQIIDCQDERAVKEKLKEKYDTAVIAMHSDFGSVLLLVIYLKESGVKNIIARAETPTQKSVLEKLGVSTVIMPEAEMGLKVAERLVLNRGEQLNLTDELSIFQVPAPDGLIGKTIKEANDIGKYALKLVFLRREYEDQDFSKIIEPTESDVLITDRDFLIILGKQRRMIKMLEDLSE